MANLGLIFICIALGIVLRRSRLFPANAATVLNRFVIYVSLPALTLVYLHSLSIDTKALYPVLMAWIVFFAGAAFFAALGKALGWDRRVTGALILTGALGNTSFLGFPLLEALYGPSALSVGILVDEPGSFLVLGTLGIVAATLYSGGRPSWRSLVRRIAVFPPFVTVFVALALKPFPMPEVAAQILNRLGETLIPLALVSVGLQLDFKPRRVRKELPKLALGLFFKLLLSPALIFLLYIVILGARGRAIQITVLESAMGPMVTGAVVAAEYGLDSELANLMVAAGIPIALLTVPIWWRILSPFG